MKWCLAIGLIVSLTAGCTFVKFTATAPGQPTKSSYSLSKEKSFDLGAIDTSVVYVNDQDWVITGSKGIKKKHLFVFLKFSSNGMAYYSNYSETPFDEELLLIIGGQYCYYKVNGDVLELEHYNHLAKKFVLWYARIYDDKLHFNKDKLRVFTGGKGKLNYVFNKKPLRFKRELVWPK